MRGVTTKIKLSAEQMAGTDEGWNVWRGLLFFSTGIFRAEVNMALDL